MKSLKIIRLIVVSLLFSQHVYSQSKHVVDSLLAILPTQKADSNRVNLLHKVANHYLNDNPNQSLKYFEEAFKLAESLELEDKKAFFQDRLGYTNIVLGNYEKAINHYKVALDYFTKTNNYTKAYYCLGNIGVSYISLHKYPEAQQSVFQALKIAEKLQSDPYIGQVYTSISYIYEMQKNFPKALIYAQKSIEKLKKGTDQRAIAEGYRRMAGIYDSMKKNKEAEKYFNQALTLYQKIDNKTGLADLYMELAMFHKNTPQKALNYRSEAKRLFDDMKTLNTMSIENLGSIGNLLWKSVQNNQTLNIPNNVIKLPASKSAILHLSEIYIDSAIRWYQKNNNLGGLASQQLGYSELLAFKGDYKKAYENLRKSHILYDSVYSQESKNQIAEIESQREIEIRDKQIKINELALENQKRQRVGLIIGLGLLAVIGGLLYWQSQTRKRTNTTLLHLNQELDEANKIKAKFFAILSHDLRSPVANLVSFLNLQKQAPDLLTPDMAATHQARIAHAAEDLLDTMEAMLLWSKSQMEHFKPQTQQVPVSELFEYLQKFFVGSAEVQITFENPQLLHVFTDEDYLKIIMQNLTNNALKALKNVPNGRICWEARQENGQVVLAITDNAGGISEQQLAALYHQNAKVSGKTGLGFHLIRDLAKAIACQISVNAQANGGTEFRLAFA
jgi:signal transduction histidine kinase